MGPASGTTLAMLMRSTPRRPHPFEPGLLFMVGLVVGYAREGGGPTLKPGPKTAASGGSKPSSGHEQSPSKKVLLPYPWGSAHYGTPTYRGLTATPRAAAFIRQSAFNWKGWGNLRSPRAGTTARPRIVRVEAASDLRPR